MAVGLILSSIRKPNFNFAEAVCVPSLLPASVNFSPSFYCFSLLSFLFVRFVLLRFLSSLRFTANPTCDSANASCPFGYTALDPATVCSSLTCNLTDCCVGSLRSATWSLQLIRFCHFNMLLFEMGNQEASLLASCISLVYFG